MQNTKLLLVGLGNPGKEYENNRHNFGYLILDQIQNMFQSKNSKSQIHFLKPDQFMNNSGKQVKEKASYFKIGPSDIVVIHDDVDLDFGKVRINFGSGSGGHNGVKSIIEYLKTQDFWRVRIGIGRPREGQETDNYVLEDFTPGEKKNLDKIIDAVAEVVVESISKSEFKEKTINIL